MCHLPSSNKAIYLLTDSDTEKQITEDIIFVTRILRWTCDSNFPLKIITELIKNSSTECNFLTNI